MNTEDSYFPIKKSVSIRVYPWFQTTTSSLRNHGWTPINTKDSYFPIKKSVSIRVYPWFQTTTPSLRSKEY